MGRMGRTLVILGAVLATSFAQQKATTTYSPQELVRRMVESELRAQQVSVKWRLFSRTEADGKSFVAEKVQSSGGTLRRMLAVNGKQPSAEEQAEEQRKLEQFVNDRRAQEKKLREQREDAEKARRMFQMFPDAFLYSYGGAENGLEKLHFTPNPAFDPPTREAMVFHAMSGTMWIEPKQMRFAKMQASLTDDVNFGFGLLGHLKRGGTFYVEQKEIQPGLWEVVQLDLNLRGRAILLKSISIQQKELNYGFERLPDHLDAAGALAVLRRSERTVASINGK